MSTSMLLKASPLVLYLDRFQVKKKKMPIKTRAKLKQQQQLVLDHFQGLFHGVVWHFVMVF